MPLQSNLLGSGCPPLQCQASVGVITAASAAVTAAGTTQGTAATLPSDYNVITTAAASSGVILPACGASGNIVQPPDTIIVVNHGANSVTVYPPVGGKVANGATNAGLALAATKSGTYTAIGANLYAASVSA